MLFSIFFQDKEPIYAPIPYSFNYISETEDGGKSSHDESGDGSGRVTGSYTVNNLEGHSRTVEYIADAEGFRATVRSNEPGLVNANPAGVTMETSGAAASPVLNSAPIARPVAPRPAAGAGAATGRTGVRYVLVPINE